MDIKKLKEIFVDETREMIEALESGLLELEKNPGSTECLNRVFRAAHTIKGSSASLGFSEISRFTHTMEEVLDLMRQGSLEAGTSLVSLLLRATDFISSMIGAVVSDGTFDANKFNEISQALKRAASGEREKVFEVVFSPSPDLFRRGINPLVTFQEMQERGILIESACLLDGLPELQRLDPESMYLAWRLKLKAASQEEIREFFSFMEEDCSLSFVSSAAQASNAPASTEGRVRSASVRIEMRKLDSLINAVGEMTILHSMMQQLIEQSASSDDIKLKTVFAHLQTIGRDIQEKTLSLRMLPVGEVFGRFERLVRELSNASGKQVALRISGEETELDKGVLEKIYDPLVHIIRNAIDHGIENPEARRAAGKPDAGTINLAAYQMGDSVFIDVSDDGRGLNQKRILERAAKMGLLGEGAEADPLQFIFLPGFSTAENVTDVSGRGVGMDVVRRNIEALNGTVGVRSEEGRGTLFSIKLPLTLAIINGMTARIGEDAFIVPVASVIESMRPSRDMVNSLHEQGEVISIRGEYVPLVRMRGLLGIGGRGPEPWEAIVIIVGSGPRKCGLLVDEILGEQQVVIKTLGEATPKVRDISGGTILGNGQVALVLDIPGIVDSASKGRQR